MNLSRNLWRAWIALAILDLIAALNLRAYDGLAAMLIGIAVLTPLLVVCLFVTAAAVTVAYRSREMTLGWAMLYALGLVGTRGGPLSPAYPKKVNIMPILALALLGALVAGLTKELGLWRW